MDYDFIVIGAGSGGVRAARMAAQLGVKVALIEGAAVGGTCVNVGCIPKKLYAYAAGYAAAFEEAKGFGWKVREAEFDWELLKSNRRQEIDRLNRVYIGMLQNAGVDLLQGWAQIVGPNEVRVDDTRRLSARRILVATGGVPIRPHFDGAELAISSDQIFDLPELPKRLAVIGGGYIASEFASIFNGLGVHVTQIHRGPGILRGFDEEIALFAQRGLQTSGVDLRLGRLVRKLEQFHGAIQLSLDDSSTVQADAVLYATGRQANLQRLGWHAAGGTTSDDGHILVDVDCQSSIHGIFAVGDVASGTQLTPVALAQAMKVVRRLFVEGQQTRPGPEDDLVPSAVFMEPCIATVGLTEAQARNSCETVEIYTSDFRPLRHTLSGSAARTLVKLIVDAKSRKLLGVHLVGDDAAEILQGFAVAMRAGASKEDLDGTLGIHPTSAEELCTLRHPTRVIQRTSQVNAIQPSLQSSP